MNILVGYSGFVGSNLCKNSFFDLLCNSKNISVAYGKNPDVLVYAGVRAEKFIANANPDADFELILQAIDNIKKINPKRIVLVSSIDVCNESGINEDHVMLDNNLHAYGKNRLYLEQWVRDNIKNHTVVRLPALFGKNLKKNFIFDLINRTPQFLGDKVFTSLKNKNRDIDKFYQLQDNGFYKLVPEYKKQAETLVAELGFSSLSFTDSRAVFLFYNLEYLFGHIQVAIQNNIPLLHLAVEPLCVAEIYKYIYGKEFKNEISDNYPRYSFFTKYSRLFGGHDGYIFFKPQILEEIKTFVTGAAL